MKNFYVFTLSKVQVVKKILASCVSSSEIDKEVESLPSPDDVKVPEIGKQKPSLNDVDKEVADLNQKPSPNDIDKPKDDQQKKPEDDDQDTADEQS